MNSGSAVGSIIAVVISAQAVAASAAGTHTLPPGSTRHSVATGPSISQSPWSR